MSNREALADTLKKRKDYDECFNIFTQSYQQQLEFMVKLLQRDMLAYVKGHQCCGCFDFLSSKTNEEVHQKRKNPAFYKFFRALTPKERQEYFDELLDFIQKAHDVFVEEVLGSELDKSAVKREFKLDILSYLAEQFVPNLKFHEKDQYMKDQALWEMRWERLKCPCKRVVVYISNFKLTLVELANQEEVKTTYDLRNYQIIPSLSSSRLKLVLHATYPMDPLLFSVQFISEEDFAKYGHLFIQISRIGKLQNIINSIDLSDFIKEGSKTPQNSKLLKQTFLGFRGKMEEEDRLQQTEEEPPGSSELLERRASKLLKKKRTSTIRNENYVEARRHLIEALNQLAKNKEDKNAQVRQFKNRAVIPKSKPRSAYLNKVLESREAQLHSANRLSGELKEGILNVIKRTQSIETNTANQLRIINLKSIRDSEGGQEHEDSFYNDDVFHGKASRGTKQLIGLIYETKVKPHVKNFPNVFRKMYPKVEFTEIENIYDMEKQDLLKYYTVPETVIAEESGKMRGQKLRRFRQGWLEALTSSCRIFRHRKEDNSFQLYFHSDLEIKSLVSAILDVEAYPQWHPQVRETRIHAVIAADNILMYSLVLEVPGVERGLTFHFILHLFKINRQYYLAHKTIEMEGEKPPAESSWRRFLPWREKPESAQHFGFLLMRLSPDKIHNLNELFVSVVMPDNMQHREEVLNYFINFYFLKSYWQLAPVHQTTSPRLRLEWVVAKESFEDNQFLNASRSEVMFGEVESLSEFRSEVE